MTAKWATTNSPRPKEATMSKISNTSTQLANMDRVIDVPSKLAEDLDGSQLRFDPWVILRRSLRGRYGWVLALACVCALAGGVLGWCIERPQYKSEGLVRIAYSLPPILRETDLNQGLPMFDSYMRSQALRMVSRSLVEAALTKINDGRPPSPETLIDVADRLAVEHPSGDEHLRVTYVDSDPPTAAAVVQAVVSQFRVEYDEQDHKAQDQRFAVLDAHRGELQAKLDDIQNQADRLLINDSVQRHTTDQRQLLLSEQLAAAEQLLHQYRMEEARLEDALAALRQGGYLEGHPKVVEAKFSLERTKRLIVQFEAECRRLRGLAGPVAGVATDDTFAAGADGATAGAPTSPAAMADPIAFEARKLKLDRLEADAAAVRKELADTTERTEALKLESAESRLEIISAGDVPLQPFRDRRKMLAWLGGATGGALPVVILMLLNIARPRYRYSDETEVDVAGPAGLLGILPALPDRLSDPESAAGAAQCVHQMRVMLQVASGGRPRQYLLTSACSGEGKTSLTMALALSFTASGSRTLIVDCDLVGRVLTRGLGAGDEMGLFEALGRGDALRYIRRTHAGVWFLPAGKVNALYASKVSHLSIRKFLGEMRKEFDVVLVDSGPVLGSVEAATVAPEVDGVIVAVTRGQQSHVVDKTAHYLRAIGARIEGYVFNRAKPKDFHHSAYGTSLRPMSSRNVLVRVVSDDVDGMLRFGPLVESVMSSLPEQEHSAA
jgi:Mrp family chromosome partitioning ATPase